MEPLDIDRSDRLAAVAVPFPVHRDRRRGLVLPAALTAVAIMAGGALFLSGYSMGRQAAAEPGTPGNDGSAFRPFWDTYHTITDRYAGGDVSREAIVQGAIRGMIDSLDDPYSQYLTSGEYRSNLQGISGEFEGIGAELATQASDGTANCATLGPTCRLVIIAPIGGSPAEKAGLRPGDLVLATDGVSLDGMSVDDARARIRGPKGTVLELSVLRGIERPFALKVTRDVILEQEVVTKAFGDGVVGYVQLRGFSDRAATALTGAVRTNLEAGRTKLILDLRGNPGGYVTAARVVASQFIGSGTIFWEQDAHGNQIPTEATPGGVATDPRIAVIALIDRGSASASEIVAAALQDSGRAMLVGQRSFGKGTVQQWQELPGEGGAFRLTIARWLSPAKRWIHNVGIEPDVAVVLPTNPLPGKDPTLDRALELLGAAPVGPLR
jgi:carboxyl-terminal processing protease